MKVSQLTEKQQVLAVHTEPIPSLCFDYPFAQNLNELFLVSFVFCSGASANLLIILYTIHQKNSSQLVPLLQW